jgi:hypothetical protein
MAAQRLIAVFKTRDITHDTTRKDSYSNPLVSRGA